MSVQNLNWRDICAIAKEYAALPIEGTPDEVASWGALARVAYTRELEIRRILDVTVAPGQHYADHNAMFKDISEGRLVVSSDNSEHPVWNTSTNIAFRIWHDYAHYQSVADFELGGELAVFDRQLVDVYEHSTDPVAAQLALFTEDIGQLAYRLVNGVFGPQKCAWLKSWSYEKDYDCYA